MDVMNENIEIESKSNNKGKREGPPSRAPAAVHFFERLAESSQY